MEVLENVLNAYNNAYNNACNTMHAIIGCFSILFLHWMFFCPLCLYPPRSCTDVLCCVIFMLVIIGYIALGIVGKCVLLHLGLCTLYVCIILAFFLGNDKSVGGGKKRVHSCKTQ